MNKKDVEENIVLQRVNQIMHLQNKVLVFSLAALMVIGGLYEYSIIALNEALLYALATVTFLIIGIMGLNGAIDSRKNKLRQ